MPFISKIDTFGDIWPLIIMHWHSKTLLKIAYTSKGDIWIIILCILLVYLTTKIIKIMLKMQKIPQRGVGVTPTPLPQWTSTMADLNISDRDHQNHIFFEKNK